MGSTKDSICLALQWDLAVARPSRAKPGVVQPNLPKPLWRVELVWHASFVKKLFTSYRSFQSQAPTKVGYLATVTSDYDHLRSDCYKKDTFNVGCASCTGVRVLGQTKQQWSSFTGIAFWLHRLHGNETYSNPIVL